MPRILGVDIPKEKRIETSLTYIYGIGTVIANKILKEAQINPDTRAKNLSEEELSKIVAIIQKSFKTEGDLRRTVSQNIRRLIDVSSYRGYRHRRGLPARGQRTKTNARTRKGPRRTTGMIKAKKGA